VADAEFIVGAPIPPENQAELSNYDQDGTNFLAECILQKKSFLSHAQYLYEYTGSHWVEVERDYVRNLARKIDRSKKETTRARRDAVLHYIEDTCYERHIKWNDIKISEVPFCDGVYDIETGATRPHRKEDHLQTVIPHPVPTAAGDCSAWLNCLETYFGGDEDKTQKIAAIQEFFGYCLMAGHARYKKALLLTGDTDCGKSTIPMAIGWMVGTGNCCSVSIEDMDDQKKVAPILGKLVNRMGELKSNAAVADGGFKKLVSTGDSVSVEKKYRDTIEYTPVAKHVIATNNLPTVNDRSKATFNRMLLIKFNHSIPKDKQTTDVYDAIQAQLPGLIAWALEGARRLFRAQGKFTAIPESDREINDYRQKQNPLLEFLDDYCERDPDSNIPRNIFQQRLEAYGVNKYKTSTALSRDLAHINVEIKKVKCKGYPDKWPVRALAGWRFKSDRLDGDGRQGGFTVESDGRILPLQ